jgi:hypothetical protein
MQSGEFLKILRLYVKRTKLALGVNQSGMGIVGVMVAAAIVVVAALAVSHFVVSQTRQSVQLQFSGDCQNIANSLAEYISKDEGSLFISSFGPTPGTTKYAQNLDKSVDGVDRFYFGAPINSFTTAAPAVPPSMDLGPGPNVPLPPGWRFFNYLNIKNSTNRLIALAETGNFCCDAAQNLNLNNCGTRFFSTGPNPVTRPGFTITDKNVDVDLGVTFQGLACTGGGLSLANLPDSTTNTSADFKVRVTMNNASPAKVCEATGTVQRKIDTTPTLTIVDFVTDLCAGGQNSPAQCPGNFGAPISFLVRTLKNNSGTTCETNCFKKIAPKTCAQMSASPTVPNLYNGTTNATCNSNCTQSEPGTSFLCRIGEKSWFDNPANKTKWEPCELATVKDFDGSSIPNSVKITYQQLAAANLSQPASQAQIDLTNLRSQRGYEVDVRAIDTSGNVGPSFCDTSPSACPGS